MQHTLIPLEERKRLHREYYMRVTVVGIVALAAAVIVGAAALFPAFIRAWFDNYAAQGAVAADSRNKVTDANLNQAKSELEYDSKLVAALAADQGYPRFTDILRELAPITRGARVTNLGLSFADQKTISVVLTGITATRDGLLSLKGRLESHFAGAKIDIPISQLARSVDLPFTLRFNIQKP